ncbi:DUF3558 family protein [Prauserella muralis]|uniref:DUF3558 family protein n=1 Tax=Prauserella muralis TaxID=588067 RepID=UPI0011AC54B6|nr:DUF3558 family protein [Prauserella muralis]TWE22177.1 uncharacterized protein DUF3558 [Prauserella muralis]
MPIRRPLLLLCCAGVAVLGTACGQPRTEAGTPVAASASATTATAPAASRGALDPCALLGPADRSAAGLTSPGVAKRVGEASACDYTEPGTFGVTITVDGTSGLADLRTEHGRAEPLRIGAHDALRVADEQADDGTCAVLLGTGESASVHVDVSNSSFSDTALACDRARTVADLIEARL